jgi:hypothetical protein
MIPIIVIIGNKCSFISAVSLSQFRFPIDKLDFMFILKAYLANKGQTDRQFQNNLLSRDWVRSFLKRHCDLTWRFTAKIKRLKP